MCNETVNQPAQLMSYICESFRADTLTGCHLEGLEFDRFDVVDESRHLLRGVHLTAGRTLREGHTHTTDPSLSPLASQTSVTAAPGGSYLICVWLLQVCRGFILLVFLALSFATWRNVTKENYTNSATDAQHL